jgi:hypothetical protein
MRNFTSAFPIVLSGLRDEFPRLGGTRSLRAKRNGFCAILPHGADPYIADGVWSYVARASHTVLICVLAALLPFAAVVPDLFPFFKGKQKLDFPPFAATALQLERVYVLVGNEPLRVPLGVNLARSLRVCSPPLPCPLRQNFLHCSMTSAALFAQFLPVRSVIRASRLFVLIWHRSRSSLAQIGIMGGISTALAIPSYIYHVGTS